MVFRTKCPQCGSILEDNESYEGQLYSCHECGKEIILSKEITQGTDFSEKAGVAGIFGCLIIGVLSFVMPLLGLAIHAWTVVIAYSTDGFLAAIITGILPVFSEVFWFIQGWSVTGTVFNTYCLAVLAYIICWIIMGVGYMMLGLSRS